jgi:hypothetical protein
MKALNSYEARMKMAHPEQYLTLAPAPDPTVRTTVSIYDPTKLDFNVSADLTVTLDLFGLKVEVAGDRREQMMAMFESLLTDFEAKAVSLDIREGNYG